MPRPALAATRALAVLNFLAAHPGEAFTLSDIAARLGVNVASTHALMGVLTDAGYVSRHPRLRTFTLGPSVVALGTAALECHPAIDLARDAARELARRSGLEVAVTAAAGDAIVFLARAGEHSARGVPVHVGQRVPLRPPLGSVFVAWGDPEPWLAQSPEPDALRPVLAAVRARGYSVALEPDARRGLGTALDELAANPGDEGRRGAVSLRVADLNQRDYQLEHVADDGRYRVSMIAAPIFDSSGDVALSLTLLGFEGELGGDQVAAYGEQVRDEGLVVTRRSRGRVPAP